MRRPTADRRPAVVRPLLEESSSPVRVVPVGSAADQTKRHAVTRQPRGKAPVLRSVILRRELAAGVPALIPDTPESHFERLGRTTVKLDLLTRPLISERSAVGWHGQRTRCPCVRITGNEY